MSDIAGPLDFVVDEVESIVNQRHKKYGPTNISGSPGGPLNGIRVRLFDKLARLNNYVDNNAAADFSDDSLRDCFIDIAGYGLIGLLVLDGNWPGVRKPTKPGGSLFPPPGEPGHVMFCLPGGPCGCQPRPPSPLAHLAEGVTIPPDSGTVSIPIIQPVKYEPPF